MSVARRRLRCRAFLAPGYANVRLAAAISFGALLAPGFIVEAVRANRRFAFRIGA